MQRRLISLLAVAATGLALVAVARGTRKPYNPDAPEYRQKGPKDAPITIVEYSDFQCPACRVAVEPLKGLETMYSGKLRLVFKHFPLERPHPWARRAAAYGECAGKQGKFWEMFDVLYAEQPDWGASQAMPEDKFKAYAKKAGVDAKQLEACLADPATDAAVMADVTEGDNRWVSSTPTFFLNGKRLVGARQLGQLGPIYIDRALRK